MPEHENIQAILADQTEPHWVWRALQSKGQVVSLNALTGKDGMLPLPPQALLILAQPRPLSPQENVALDAWVQGGGRVLLFADPLLTQESRFALGDPRRPQVMALLSPILRRWGLELTFDESQQAEPHIHPSPFGKWPTFWHGQFVHAGNSRDDSKASDSRKSDAGVGVCKIEDEGLIAECIVGKGRVLAIADAFIIENKEENSTIDESSEIFKRLLDHLDFTSSR